MPFKSRAQQKWMYANKPEMATRWEKETPSGRLPKKVDARAAAIKELIKQRK